MKKDLFKKSSIQFLRLSVLMACCILAGFLLIAAVYKIPVDKMWSNVQESVKTFEREGLYFPVQESINSRLDNFTDSFMVNNVISSGQISDLDDAMENYRVSVKGGTNIDALSAYIHNDQYSLWSYGRYWHGYLVLLKPLFLIFNYSQIRSINTFFHIMLMCAVCIGLVKRGKGKFCIPLAVAWYVLCPPAVMLSLQFSSVFNITFAACLVILLFHEHFEKRSYVPFFLIVGAITSFLDLLTYPVLTVLIPLTLILIIRQNNSASFLKTTKDIVAYGASWGIGFLAMWAGKWILATMLTDNNVLLKALDQIKLRTSNTSSGNETIAITTGLAKCIETLLIPPVQFILLVCLIVSVLILIKNRKHISCRFVSIYPFVFISIIPIIWLLITNNHSSIHFWFTYRNLAATVFALYSGILAQIEQPSQDNDSGTAV